MKEQRPTNRGKEIATAVANDVFALGALITAVAEQTASNPVSQSILRVTDNMLPPFPASERPTAALAFAIGSAGIAALSTVFWRKAFRG
jgi:hypothetical protein